MSTPKVNHLCDVISCHAWNKAGDQVAYSPNNKEIIIASYKNGKFETIQTLKEHDSFVSSIDWAPESDKIVSCSHDRNALVWTRDEKGNFQPELVLLRNDFAATHVKWSPDETKFACTTGNKLVAICHYDEDNKWWSSTHIKKFKSTCTHVAWSPDSKTVAVTSNDFKVRICNAMIKGFDKGKCSSDFAADVEKSKFGQFLWEGESKGWTRSVAFNPSANCLAYVSHDSSISFVIPAGADTYVQTIKTDTLPFMDVYFPDDNTCIAVGYNFNPYKYIWNGNEWEFSGKIDPEKKKTNAGTASAKDIFKSMDSRGTADTTTAADEIPTFHKNTVTCIQKYKDSFTTSGLDGNLIMW